MGKKRRIEELLGKLRSFAKEIVRLDNEINQTDTKYVEEEKRVTITKELDVKLLIASVKFIGVVEKVFRLKNDDRTGRTEGICDSSEDDLEDSG